MKPVKSKFFVRKNFSRAFSLVEVALAIGVFAFSILAIAGLVGVSLNADRYASADTRLALMTETVSSILKNQGFANISTNSLYNLGASPAIYFNVNGQAALAGNNTVQFATMKSDSVYACTVTRTLPSSFTAQAGASTNLICVTLTFGWPVTAANQTTYQNVRTVNTTIANYD